MLIKWIILFSYLNVLFCIAFSVKSFDSLLVRMFTFSRPMIAAVEGHASMLMLYIILILDIASPLYFVWNILYITFF